MSQTLVFATRNHGKVAEMRELIADPSWQVSTVDAVAADMPEVVEDGATFLANALKKAHAVANYTQLPALADDSGLQVDALNDDPGVLSARYAGPTATDADNNRKLLAALREVPDGQRQARFRCVLAFVDPKCGVTITAAGQCEGKILREPQGDDGFGYDPLFYCLELQQTFAQAGIGPKGGVSHRARAISAILPALRGHLTAHR